VSYHGVHTGYKQMIMRPEELLARIRLPRARPEMIQYYRKVGTRKAQAISKVCFAATAVIKQETIADLRVALGSVAPVPLRCIKTEETLRGSKITASAIEKAKDVFAAEIVPIDDVRSTRNYRLNVSINLLEDFLRQVGA
jgi:CO/xanthine dehydrogenase FAD-binding subunit